MHLRADYIYVICSQSDSWPPQWHMLSQSNYWHTLDQACRQNHQRIQHHHPQSSYGWTEDQHINNDDRKLSCTLESRAEIQQHWSWAMIHGTEKVTTGLVQHSAALTTLWVYDAQGLTFLAKSIRCWSLAWMATDTTDPYSFTQLCTHWCCSISKKQHANSPECKYWNLTKKLIEETCSQTNDQTICSRQIAFKHMLSQNMLLDFLNLWCPRDTVILFRWFPKRCTKKNQLLPSAKTWCDTYPGCTCTLLPYLCSWQPSLTSWTLNHFIHQVCRRLTWKYSPLCIQHFSPP